MNVDALLEPVDGDDPCGIDLSFSREFDAIHESRRADDPTLAQGEWKKPLKSADWPGVALQCEALLRRRSKDLRVAAWLAGAWARTHAFDGLADGLVLNARLCETWWHGGLHPRPDGGDMAPRVGSLDWLLGQVVEVAAANGGQAHDGAAVQRAVEALARLQAVVDERLGADGPAFGAASKALDTAQRQCAPVARPDAPASGPHAGPPAAPAFAGALSTRSQALEQLRAVADFFRRTEPHSPVAYLADKAAAWGEMPLHVWLRTVLRDPGALGQIEDLLGVPRPPE